MQTFSKRVTVEPGFEPAFFFTKIYTIQGVRFQVSVIDMEDQAWSFNMVLKNLEWKIINAPQVPSWIVDVENQLQEIIFSNMSDWVSLSQHVYNNLFYLKHLDFNITHLLLLNRIKS